MVRPTRTTAQIREAIIRNVAVYTCARTDWEGERRESKKKALRTAARLTRQLCARGKHRIGWEADGRKPEAYDCCHVAEGLPFKCPVCDPSGDAKREANIGTEAMDERRKRTAEAFDIATGKRKGPPKVEGLGNCATCHAMMEARFLTGGVCDMCLATKED